MELRAPDPLNTQQEQRNVQECVSVWRDGDASIRRLSDIL